MFVFIIIVLRRSSVFLVIHSIISVALYFVLRKQVLHQQQKCFTTRCIVIFALSYLINIDSQASSLAPSSRRVFGQPTAQQTGLGP